LRRTLQHAKGEEAVDSAGGTRVRHSVNNAFTRISVPLQLLEQRTPLSEHQRQLVGAALRGLAELDTILRQDVSGPAKPAPGKRRQPTGAR
jgi:hypothetical protein